MSKYKVVTDKGTFIVETEDSPAPDFEAARQKFAVESSKINNPNPTRAGATEFINTAKEGGLNALEGVGQFFAGLPGMAVETGKMAINALDPSQMQQRVDAGLGTLQGGKNALAPLANDAKALVNSNYAPSTPEQQRGYQNFAGQNLGALLTAEAVAKGPSIAQALGDAIPSKARAGVKFQNVMGAARNEPLSLAAADDAALRAQELAGRGAQPGRGSSMPKVMRDYLRTRESNPTMTYEIGRDFQSSAGRLSSAEAQAANPVMKAQVAKLAKALAESNRAAAVKVGMGAEYDAAMAEYAKAARMADMKGSLIDVMKNRAVQTGIGTGAAYGIYRALSGH